MRNDESNNDYDYNEYGSAWNEPASLLAAVLRMREKGIPPEAIRIIPLIGHVSQPEIVSRPLQDTVQGNTRPDDLHWLYVNIRPQNRLRWLYPLFHQGPMSNTFLPERDTQLQTRAEQKAEEIWNEFFAPNLEPNQQEIDSLETHQWLLDCNPEWIERLGFIATQKGWVQPGYATPVQWLARLWRTLYPELTLVPLKERPHPFRLRLVNNKLIHEPNPNQKIRVRDDGQAGQLRDDATLLAEKFFTLLFLHLASIEMLEGVAIPMDWMLDPFGNPFDYCTGKDDQKFEQNGLLGGLGLDGVLLRLMQDWMEEDGFLGLSREDWKLFGEPAEQGVLWMLLLKRREVTDYGALFERAVHLLISKRARIHIEAYQGVDSQLGTLLAQPGLTLILDGKAVLRAPEAIVYLPHDRMNEPAADLAVKRLEILRRLFLPAHIPLRCRWMADFAALDESAWLVEGNGHLPEEEFPLQSYLANED